MPVPSPDFEAGLPTAPGAPLGPPRRAWRPRRSLATWESSLPSPRRTRVVPDVPGTAWLRPARWKARCTVYTTTGVLDRRRSSGQAPRGHTAGRLFPLIDRISGQLTRGELPYQAFVLYISWVYPIVAVTLDDDG